MSALAHSRVGQRLRRLVEAHETGRRGNRWQLRGFGWGTPLCLWMIVYYGDGPEKAFGGGCLVPLLIFGGIVEAGLRFAYRSTARVAAREFNRAFPGGTARDDAVALLRERGRERREPGRAARRCLRALHLPFEEPPEETEPSPEEVPAPDLSPPGPELRPARRLRPPAATIPIEVTPRTRTPPTSREPAPLPLQPEAAQGGENE